MEIKFGALKSVKGETAITPDSKYNIIVTEVTQSKTFEVTDDEIYKEDMRRRNIEERTFRAGAKWMRERMSK
jgi:hypothetical protein